MRITLQSRLIPDGDQIVNVQDDLLVRQLITTILSRYSLGEGNYVLRQGTSQILDPDKSLEAQNIRMDMVLIFSKEQPENSPATSFIHKPRQAPAFLSTANGRVFAILRNPAYVGRPKGTEFSAYMLDIDLSTEDPNRTVSRPHARISHEDSQYFIESLVEYNLTYVNGQPVPLHEKHLLCHGDEVCFGEVELVFGLRDAILD